MKLVEFSNGKFGIKRGLWPFIEYASLTSNNCFWWSYGGDTFYSCQGTKEDCLEYLDKFYPKIIKETEI